MSMATARANRRRKERMLANGPRESYTLEEMGDRDAWVCGLCHDSVDRQYIFPDPASPSVDHVLEIVLGGTDNRDNVRITHLFCNQDRRDSPARTVPPITLRGPNGLTLKLGGDRPARPGWTPEEARARLAARIAEAKTCQVALLDPDI